ncbi:MAG: GDSL-type esterase/lipase family protein [Clostridia bacterium]|nr:GDSL-type esterase/lipase family protein [Clostridia bacterium]
MKVKSKLLSAVIALAMGISCAPNAIVQAEGNALPEWYIARAEFDGTDDTSRWAKYGASDYKYSGAAPEITNNDSGLALTDDGLLKITANSLGSGAWGIRFGTGENVAPIDQTKQNICLDVRFKFDQGLNGELLKVGGQRNGDTEDDYHFLFIAVKNGNLAYGGQNLNEATEQDYAINTKTWYTMNIRLDYKEKKSYINITDENGNVGEFVSNYLWGQNWTNITEVATIKTAMLNNSTSGVQYAYIDYLRLYDKDKIPNAIFTYGENENTLNGAKISGKSIPIKIVFPSAVTFDDLSRITIDNNAVITPNSLSGDGKTAEFMAYNFTERTKYTITVPQIGENIEQTVSFQTADADYYIMRAEFDGLDDTTGWGRVTNNANHIKIDGLDSKISDGWLSIDANAVASGCFSICPDNKYSIDNTKENIYVQTRFNATSINQYRKSILRIKANRKTSPTGDADEYSLLSIVAQLNETSGENELKYGYYGNEGTALGYNIATNKNYTLKAKLDYKAQSIDITIIDEDNPQNVFNKTMDFFNKSAGWSYTNLIQVDSINCGSGTAKNSVDYVRVWDADLIPGPSAVYGDEKALDGDLNIKEGTVARIDFPVEVTQEVLSSITLDDNPIEGTVSDDGYSVYVTLNNIGTRTCHTLKTIEVSGIKAAEFKFRSADEEKYLYRAEFDGNDDAEAWWASINDEASEKIEENQISDGVFKDDVLLPSRKLDLRFDKTANGSLNCTDLENVLIETRFKFTNISEYAQYFRVGGYMAYITVQDKVLKYGGDFYNSKGTPLYGDAAEYTLSENVWYTMQMRTNFVTDTYTLTIDDGNGHIATTLPIGFVYNKDYESISQFSYPRYGTQVDYLRIINEDYGHLKVTYREGAALDNSVLVDVSGEIFTFEPNSIPQSLDGITICDENNNTVPVTVATTDSKITVANTQDFDYNTKYVLTIPKEITGAEADQTVQFTTIWNDNAQFDYETAFAGKDGINAVFLGGSITWQDIGYRKYIEECLGALYPNSTFTNAGVGGTGAQFGWTRLYDDVIAKNPDLVFVEFAVNDAANMQTAKWMESIVRNLNALEKRPVIIFVYTTATELNANSYAIFEHEKIAKAYGIPSINLRDYVKSKCNLDASFADDWNGTKYLSDGKHQTQAGGELYGTYATNLLKFDAKKYFVLPKNNESVTALCDYKDYLYKYTQYDDALTAEKSYTVIGDEFVLKYANRTTGGAFTVTIDGTSYSYNSNSTIDTNPDTIVTFSNLGNGTHTVAVVPETGVTVVVSGIYTIRKTGYSINMPVFDKQAVTFGDATTVTYSYTSNEEKNVVLIAALYDENGVYKRCVTKDIKLSISDEPITDSVVVTPAENEKIIRAFVWDSLDNMTALSDENELR